MRDRAEVADPIALARRAIDAINAGEEQALRDLLADDVELNLGRGLRRGPAAVLAWANKQFDHLDRRYAIEEFHPGPATTGAVGVGTVDYLWREENAVGDSSPIALELDFADRRLRRVVVHADPDAALRLLG